MSLEAIARVRELARLSGSSFYPAFRWLPSERRDAISALYAWCRRSDDIADGSGTVAEKRRMLAAWRLELERSLCGQTLERDDATHRALPLVLARYPIPPGHFRELLAGVEMDLDVARYATFADLRHYIYRVAGVVGLMSIEVFGYRDPGARAYAVDLGTALQLVNILRDVAQDLERGRVYLPLEDLARHGVTEEDLLARRDSPELRRAAAETGARARDYFRRARASLPACDRASLFPAEAMAGVYRRLLGRIEAQGYDLFGPRPRVSRPSKAAIALATYVRSRWLA